MFAASNGMTDDLWVINADGTGAEMLLECVDPCVAYDDPAWSPDGSAVLYSEGAIAPSGEIGLGSLQQVTVATGEITVLLPTPEPDFVAGQRYSPDGTKVVLEWVHTDGSGVFEQVTAVELAVIDLTATPPTMHPITEGALFAVTADWSPDGSIIVYSALPAPDSPAPELFSIRPDGTGLTQLTHVTDTGGSAEQPTYLADGNTIVFVGSTDGSAPTLMQLDLTTGKIGPAVGDTYVRGVHPRSRLAAA